MRGRSKWRTAGLGVMLALGACARGEEPAAREPGRSAAGAGPAATAADPAHTGAELAAAQERIVARADSARDALVSVRALSRKERSDLRSDVNARQVATARVFGVRASGDSEIERLVRQGRLVELADSTELWVLRDLEHSVPFVTPDTRAMLQEVGRRFHERLDSLGIPRYRMEVTSVLRTPETQAELRSSNGNAARGVSAHEFGTTMDIAHTRFAAPAPSALTAELPSAPEQTAQLHFVEGVMLEDVARKHAVALQAELGRVLREMRQEGKVRVMMERRQAVYHITVARRFPARVAEE